MVMFFVQNCLRTNLNLVEARRYFAVRKRFYKRTGIISNKDNFEVTLDQKRLKTPAGNVFQVNSKALALAVANEWDSQGDKINQSTMYLTSLCNGVIDNIHKITKENLVERILEFLPTDTILFQSSDNDTLYDLQKQEWDPIIEWFCNRYNVIIKKSREIFSPTLDHTYSVTLTKHLLSYDYNAVYGILFGTESLKSLILTMASIEKVLDVRKAVLLSRLEQEFQLQSWSRIKWAHDLDHQDLQARLSAAVLFVYYNSNFRSKTLKN